MSAPENLALLREQEERKKLEKRKESKEKKQKAALKAEEKKQKAEQKKAKVLSIVTTLNPVLVLRPHLCSLQKKKEALFARHQENGYDLKLWLLQQLWCGVVLIVMVSPFFWWHIHLSDHQSSVVDLLFFMRKVWMMLESDQWLQLW